MSLEEDIIENTIYKLANLDKYSGMLEKIKKSVSTKVLSSKANKVTNPEELTSLSNKLKDLLNKGDYNSISIGFGKKKPVK